MGQLLRQAVGDVLRRRRGRGHGQETRRSRSSRQGRRSRRRIRQDRGAGERRSRRRSRAEEEEEEAGQRRSSSRRRRHLVDGHQPHPQLVENVHEVVHLARHCGARNSKSEHQLMQNTSAGILSLSSG